MLTCSRRATHPATSAARPVKPHSQSLDDRPRCCRKHNASALTLSIWHRASTTNPHPNDFQFFSTIPKKSREDLRRSIAVLMLAIIRRPPADSGEHLMSIAMFRHKDHHRQEPGHQTHLHYLLTLRFCLDSSWFTGTLWRYEPIAQHLPEHNSERRNAEAFLRRGSCCLSTHP